jgi:hypothetical protein
MGFNTRGTEQVFEEMLEKAICETPCTPFNYLEIGVAHGTTLGSVASYLRDKVTMWNAIGIDLVTGPFFDCKEFLKANLDQDVEILFNGSGRTFAQSEQTEKITVALFKENETRTNKYPPDSLNFVLIDGCHGAPCVTADFLSVEEFVPKGGIVAFHDAGLEDQGIHFQKHCNQPISVRKALIDLGLLLLDEPGLASIRPDWQLISLVDGDKSPGNEADNGHGFAFYQKI